MTEHELECCIESIRNGSVDADEKLNLLAKYLLPKALEIAKWRKPGKLRHLEDENDIANNAVHSICQRIRDGRLTYLGEKELFSLLEGFVISNVRRILRHHSAEKRSIDKTLREGFEQNGQDVPLDAVVIAETESIWLNDQLSSLSSSIKLKVADLLSNIDVKMRGLFSELVKRLADRPRQVLMIILQRDLTNEKIAAELKCSVPVIERAKAAIRRTLSELVSDR